VSDPAKRAEMEKALAAGQLQRFQEGGDFFKALDQARSARGEWADGRAVGLMGGVGRAGDGVWQFRSGLVLAAFGGLLAVLPRPVAGADVVVRCPPFLCLSPPPASPLLCLPTFPVCPPALARLQVSWVASDDRSSPAPKLGPPAR